MKTKRLVTILLATGVLATVLAQSADDVRPELEKTDRFINEVGTLVEQSGNETARDLLDQAKATQRDAWQKFNEKRYRWALGLTNQASRLAEKAKGIAEFEPSKLEDELDETDRRIERARGKVEESGNLNAIEMLKKAEETQQEARRRFRAQRYRESWDRTKQARWQVEAALRLAEVNANRIRDEIERTQRLMDEVGPAVVRSGHQQAMELWRWAQREQEAARNQFRQRNYLVGLKYTMTAREHARKAIDIIRQRIDSERIRGEVERTREMLRRAAEEIDGTDRTNAELVDKAESVQNQAEEELKAGYPLQALRFTFAARDLLMRALDMAGEVRSGLVERAIEETDAMVGQWRETIRAGERPEAQRLLDEAIENQKKAREHLGQGVPRIAWQETTLARRLVSRAIELAQSAEPVPVPEPGEGGDGEND